MGKGRQLSPALIWSLTGLAAYAALPWYFPKDLTLAATLAGPGGGPLTANGLIQVVSHGKTWLASGWIALLVALTVLRDHQLTVLLASSLP